MPDAGARKQTLPILLICFHGINLLSNSARFKIFSPYPVFSPLRRECHRMSLLFLLLPHVPICDSMNPTHSFCHCQLGSMNLTPDLIGWPFWWNVQFYIFKHSLSLSHSTNWWHREIVKWLGVPECLWYTSACDHTLDVMYLKSYSMGYMMHDTDSHFKNESLLWVRHSRSEDQCLSRPIKSLFSWSQHPARGHTLNTWAERSVRPKELVLWAH